MCKSIVFEVILEAFKALLDTITATVSVECMKIDLKHENTLLWIEFHLMPSVIKV